MSFWKPPVLHFCGDHIRKAQNEGNIFLVSLAETTKSVHKTVKWEFYYINMTE